MKHIKNKSLFESPIPKPPLSDDELQDMKDICLELEDKGYSIWWLNSNHHMMIRKDTNNHDQFERYASFLYGDVEEVVSRLKDYIGNKIANITIVIDSKCYDIKKFNYDLSDTHIKGVSIWFNNI